MQAVSKIEQLPSNYNAEQIQLLKDTVCKGASDNDLAIFGHICKRTGLDPFAKQIYAVMRKDNKLNRHVMTVQTGIDGYRLIAERTGKYSPGREPTYAYDANGKVLSSTAYIKKQTIDGTWHEVCATAFYSEYVQTNFSGVPTSFWLKMPHSQLAKCAEALALRKAFPMELSGIYTADEMAQANSQVLPENLPEAEIQEQAAEQPKLVQERMISEFEIEFLKSKLDACSTEFSDKVKNFLTEEGTINYSINEKIFSNIMKKIIKHLADHAVCEVEVKNEN
jgi:phage recombination protein Bet